MTPKKIDKKRTEKLDKLLTESNSKSMERQRMKDIAEMNDSEIKSEYMDMAQKTATVGISPMIDLKRLEELSFEMYVRKITI